MATVSNVMMICWLPWLILFAAAQITGAGLAIHGFIFPKERIVLRGSEVSVYCKLNASGWIEDVYLSTDVAPGLVDSIFNETVRKITIPNLSASTFKVTCYIRTPSSQQLDEIIYTSGYPPKAPKNVSCIYFPKQNVMCSWIPGNDPEIRTDFILTVLNDTGKNCSTTTNSCSFTVGHEQFGREYNIRLEVKNKLGKAETPVTVNLTKIVKIDPPEILTLKPLPAKSSFLLISWRRPSLAPVELDVKCSLRYRQLQGDRWDFTPDLYMEKEKEMSYNLSGLHAYTDYAVSLRCIGTSGQLWWSEWSGDLTGRTAEQAPTHSVELWRVIGSSARTRQVYLKWKESSGIRPSGVTLGYTVQWFPEDRSFDSKHKTTTNTGLMINISADAHVISVVHFNSAGRSPRATLRIPAAGEKTREVVSSFQISTSAAEGANVSWTVSDLRFRRFVLDWCIDLGDDLCNISFQYVENSTSWTIKKGTLEPYKRYKISVYPILEDRVAASVTTYFYIKEGAPLYGPNVKVEKRKKTEVTIRWDPLRLEEANGFITAFSIVYWPLNGYESVVSVNSNIYEYSLRPLMPGTLYSAYVVASTSAGNTSGNHIQFQTLADSSEYVGALVGTLGTFLLLLLVLGITYKYKKDKIKNLLWPEVPDPAYSSIFGRPSDWLQALPFLNPVWTDGALHSGDLQILHAVYVNDKKERALFLADSWGNSEAAVSLEESAIVMHYAATETCPESAACLLLVHSSSWPAAVNSGYLRSLRGGQPAAAKETLPDQELFCSKDTAVVNPYLKNTVRTREVLHMTEIATR